MSDSADFEEGEVGDFSDFEDGSLVDNSAQSPIDVGSCTSEQIVASSRCGVSVDKQSQGAIGGVGCYGLNHGHKEREENPPSLRYLLSDEEAGRHRKMPCQKRKKKKRDWGQSNSRDRLPAMRQGRVRCRFYLEGRCNKICNPRATENGGSGREAGATYAQSQIQIPQDAPAEPYGDVDYRRMVNPCPPGVGPQAYIPCGFQPSTPSALRRPPFDPQPHHIRHPRVDESLPFPPQPGCNGASSLRAPLVPPCRFPMGGLCMPPHRPPISDVVRHRPGRHPSQKSRPSFNEDSKQQEIRETPFNGDSISFQENAALADFKQGQSMNDLSSPKQSPKKVQEEMLPSMMVDEGNIIYVNKNANDMPVSDFPASSKWQLQPLDLDECPALPQSVSALASSADPRLKVAYRLPALTPAKEFLSSASPAFVEDNQLMTVLAPPPTKSAFKRRAKLQLNEMANTFAITGTPAQQQSPVAPSVLDPRLIKRRKVETATASTPTVVERKQSQSSTSMQIVSPPE
ncbi:unnamed protein product [Mesocestoides corti]|uniref:Uncharacterized protein n=2 Tax=Mesocestoides corti TaxID=53468 RepID=A0A0R3U611_MESCO|nr:unnamed protein product [Mesocestoides corti]